MSLFLPGAMMVLMLALGLRLPPGELAGALGRPKPPLTGLTVQLLGLPLLAFAIARALDLAPMAATGLILVAASPGGVTSNYATLMARGAVGLSVAMTFATSLAAPVTMPLVLALGGVAVPGEAGLWRVSAAMILVALMPMALGMAAARLRPAAAAATSRWLDPLARILFLAIVLATFVQNWGTMRTDFAEVGGAVTLFAVLAPLLAFAAARAAGVTRAETRAILIETSMQNVAITIFAASVLLGAPGLAIPGLIYAVEMNLVALLVIGTASLGGSAPGLARGRG